ncbi:MAG: hypothetical protein ABL309_14005 [Phycisphaerales bacterium]
MLDRLNDVLPQGSEAPPKLALTAPDPETTPEGDAGGFNWRVEQGAYYKLDCWIWQYRVTPIRTEPGAWKACLYVNQRFYAYSSDEFRGPDALKDALDFCETHARERLTFTNEEKADELGRVAPATLQRVLLDAAVVQGLAYERGGNIVFKAGESRESVDLDGEGVDL